MPPNDNPSDKKIFRVRLAQGWKIALSMALPSDPLTPRRPSAFRPFPVRRARKQIPVDLLNRHGMAVTCLYVSTPADDHAKSCSLEFFFTSFQTAKAKEAIAKALIKVCGKRGPVFVYFSGFETARIRELAERFPELSKPLLAINERVVDLLPIARNRYYHHSQQGSWSIKAVLPAAVPELSYDTLDGVVDGGAAMNAYCEAIQPDTTPERKREHEKQLLAYCRMDTLAMVRLWEFFTGRKGRADAHPGQR